MKITLITLLAGLIMILTSPFTVIGFIYEMIKSGFRAGKSNYEYLHEYITNNFN